MKSIFCSICGHDNAISVLVERDDREYGVSSRLKYFQCLNIGCHHVWSSPVPSSDEIATFYANYTTHEIYRPRGLGRFVNFISELLADRQLCFLHTDRYNVKSTRILDFGCGNGNNLKRLASHGFHDLVGFDFDPQAAACVSSQGFICHSKWNDLSKGEKFNIVFLNHVIEHLSNPRSSLNDILELIHSDGLLVIRTPNSRSFLARICGINWRGWETPRHLNIFTHGSLSQLLNSISECEIVQATTSNDMSFSMAISSVPKIINKYKSIKLICAFALTATSQVVNLFTKNLGEELVFKIRKK